MNLQTERIENHRAQLTIEIAAERLESAKKRAARKISRSVSIKGFRKGKAPYRLVAQYVGEETILEEAVETLGGELYKQALQESELLPYGPGVIDGFKVEPAPTFVFSVPLQPEVDLKDYADVRLDFEAPEVSDEEVDQALQQLRVRETEVLDDALQVAGLGNRVRVDVDSEFVDGGEPEATEPDFGERTSFPDSDEGEDDEADADIGLGALTDSQVPRKGDTFVKDENAIVILDPNEDPFIDGFVDALIGTELGSDVEFELTIPDDDADENIVGRLVSFVVTLKQIESIAIPELDDAFAEKIFKNRGDEVRNLDGLRESIRDDLERAALDRAKTEFSGQVLDKIVESAEIEFPQEMLDEFIGEQIEEFEANLKHQNISLDDFLRLTNSSRESLRERYQETATDNLRRSLTLREFAQAQNVEVADELIELRLDAIVAGYGQSPELRRAFDTPELRDSLGNELFMNLINARLCAIGVGEDPDEAATDLQARMAADVELAKQRSERLGAYMQETTSEADTRAGAAEQDAASEAEATGARGADSVGVSEAQIDEDETIEKLTESEDD